MPDVAEQELWEGGGRRYRMEKVVGNGAFGIVWRARTEDGETVAIKKVLLDRRYHNRELQMMKVRAHAKAAPLLWRLRQGQPACPCAPPAPFRCAPACAATHARMRPHPPAHFR